MTYFEAYQELTTMKLFILNGVYYFFDHVDEDERIIWVCSVDEEEFFEVNFDDEFKGVVYEPEERKQKVNIFKKITSNCLNLLK